MEDEGISGLYSGIASSLLGVASTNFAYFYWYSAVRTFYLSYQKAHTPPSTSVELSLGAVAGALAQLFTIPIAVVTTRQQTQRKHERKGLLETTKEIIESEDGYSGLWRGLKASLVLVINPSITYGAYQRLRILFFPHVLNLAPWQAFCKSKLSEITRLQRSNSRKYSLRGHVKSSSYDCHSTSYRCKGQATVQAATRTEWKAFL